MGFFLNWGQKNLTGRRKVNSARKICGGYRKQRKKGETGPCRWSDVGLGMRLEDWKCRVGRRVKITYLTLSLLGQLVPKERVPQGIGG